MRPNVKIITQDASCLMTHDTRYNVQCNQSVKIVIFIPLIGIPFLKNFIGVLLLLFDPYPYEELPIPLAVGTNRYTLLLGREVLDFLLQSSASKREQNHSFAFRP